MPCFLRPFKAASCRAPAFQGREPPPPGRDAV